MSESKRPDFNKNNASDEEEHEQQQRPAPVSRRKNRVRSGVATELPPSHEVGSFHEEDALIFRAVEIHGREPRLLTMPEPEVKDASSATLRIRPNKVIPVITKYQNWTPSLEAIEDVKLIQWNKGKIRLQDYPMYFPKTSINYEFPGSHLHGILNRVEASFPKLSIQVRLRDDPLSAFLETSNGVELYLVFFQEKVTRRNPSSIDWNTRKMFMSVQRRSGDHMHANAYIQELVDSAKGVDVEGIEEEEYMDIDRSTRSHYMTRRGPPSAETVLLVERHVERLASKVDVNMPTMFAELSPTDLIQSSVKQMYTLLHQPGRLDNRQLILEHLEIMTDLHKTMSESAKAGAFLILQGTAPSMNMEAKEIQRFVLNILQHRMLPGDRELFKREAKENIYEESMEMRPYFQDSMDPVEFFPTYYVDFMNRMFQLALQVLVQSLEVVECFHSRLVNDGINIHEVATDFLSAASAVADGKDLYSILVECIVRSKSKMQNGALACRIFQLLAMASPGLKERLKQDEVARSSIYKAYEVGISCHILLKEQSQRLWLTINS